MARRILEQNDINTAADTLVAEGKRPTIGLVYDLVGRRGSNSTIQKMLATWESQRGPVPTAPPVAPPMPAPAVEAITAMGGKLGGMLQALGEEVFAAAKAEADAAVAPVIEGLQAKHQELQESLATAERIEADRDAEMAQMEADLAKAVSEHLADVQRIGHLEAELEAQTAKVADLVVKEGAFQSQIAVLSEQIGFLKGMLEATVEKAKK